MSVSCFYIFKSHVLIKLFSICLSWSICLPVYVLVEGVFNNWTLWVCLCACSLFVCVFVHLQRVHSLQVNAWKPSPAPHRFGLAPHTHIYVCLHLKCTGVHVCVCLYVAKLHTQWHDPRALSVYVHPSPALFSLSIVSLSSLFPASFQASLSFSSTIIYLHISQP